MIIPAHVAAVIDSNGHTYAHLLERYEREQPAIEGLLRAAGFDGLDRVVDYGCCLGGWAWVLARLCRSVVGIDVDQAYIENAAVIAAANGMDHVEYRCAAEMSSLPDASVDGIMSVGTLQVVGTGDYWHAFFADARRSLKPGGRLLVNFASPYLPIEFLLKHEAFQYLSSHGPRFVADRHLGWMLTTWRSLRTTRIVPGRRYYAARTSVANALAAQYGFRIESPAGLYAALRQRPIESYNKGTLPMYNWLVCTKA